MVNIVNKKLLSLNIEIFRQIKVLFKMCSTISILVIITSFLLIED